MTATVRVGIYVRVSTQDQSCALQKRELAEYARARGWDVVQEFEDMATGTSVNRPMLKELMREARERQIDVVLVWKLDRFARSLRDLVLMLQELSELGIQFVSLKDQLDLSTSAGKLMMHMIGAFAEFEVALIRERVRAGLRNARAKGRRLGRPKVRDDVEIQTLRRQGRSIRQIARQAGVSIGAVQRALASGTGTL